MLLTVSVTIFTGGLLCIFLPLLANIITNNITSMWVLFVIVLSLLLVVVFFLLQGSLPFVFVLGTKLIILLSVAVSWWSLSGLGMFTYWLRNHNTGVLVVLFLVLFDLFILLLRPVTLTLRILINVTLGHTLIEMLSQVVAHVVLLIQAIELFVYVVQSYVFLILVKSYCSAY